MREHHSPRRCPFAVIALVALLGAALSGCVTTQTYEGPPLAPDAVATLCLSGESMMGQPNTSSGRKQIVLVSIDGKGDADWTDPDKRLLKFSLLPGPHTLILDYMRPTFEGSGPSYELSYLKAGEQVVKVDFEAGHNYKVVHKVQTYKMPTRTAGADINPYWKSLKIVDATTGQTVFEKSFEQ